MSENNMLSVQHNIQLFFGVAAALIPSLSLLENEYEKMQKNIYRYEAIGIIDGNPDYYNNLADKKARLKRLKSIIDVVNVLLETEKDILRIEESNGK